VPLVGGRFVEFRKTFFDMADTNSLSEKIPEKARRASDASLVHSLSTTTTSSTSSSLSHNGVDNATTDTEKPNQPLSGLQSRRSSIHLQRAQSALSTIRSRKPIGPFSHPLTHAPTGVDVVVTFDGSDDPYNPLNWAFRKKVVTTVLYGFTTMGATWASSVYSPAVGQVADEFHVSKEVSTLGLSLLLFGFGLGPLLWAPLSEVFGRKPAVLVPYFIAAVFSFGTATAKDIQTVLITRFFAGLFGSAPVTNTGGVLGDIWSAEQRGVAIVGYAMAVVGGPVLGPIVGGAIVQSYLRWRWTEYVSSPLHWVFEDLLIKKPDHWYHDDVHPSP
jgi:hypothetical protein